MEMDGQMVVRAKTNRMETDEAMVSPFNLAILRITPEILLLIAEIDEFKGAWRSVGLIAPERLSGLRRTRNHRKHRLIDPD